MANQSVILWIIGALLTFTGLAGLLLPLVPGAPLLFLGLLLGAWAEDFRHIGVWTLLLLASMAALTYVVEFVASILGVKKYGGSRRAMVGAAICGIAGIFLWIPGILLGPFPTASKEAVLQIYGAPAWGWRGWFAIHTWIATKPANAEFYTVYEVIGWRQHRGLPAMRIERPSRPLLVWRATATAQRLPGRISG